VDDGFLVSVLHAFANFDKELQPRVQDPTNRSLLPIKQTKMVTGSPALLPSIYFLSTGEITRHGKDISLNSQPLHESICAKIFFSIVIDCSSG
jgi:hypothetical protein